MIYCVQRNTHLLQILKNNHWRLVVGLIQNQINDLDRFSRGELPSEPNGMYDDDNGDEINNLAGFEHIHMVSKQRWFTCEEVEQAHNNDTAFHRFRIHLSDFLSDSLPSHSIQLPDNSRIQLTKDDTVIICIYSFWFLLPLQLTSTLQITEYHALKVDYESTVDWRMAVDILRCNPCFHKCPWYDCIMLQTTKGPIFGALVMLFTCVVDTTEHPIALVQPYDAYAGPLRNKDRDCGFYQVHTKPRSKAEFFFAQSVIWGAYIVPDFDEHRDFFVDDLIDADMFLQMEGLGTWLHWVERVGGWIQTLLLCSSHSSFQPLWYTKYLKVKHLVYLIIVNKYFDTRYVLHGQSVCCCSK